MVGATLAVALPKSEGNYQAGEGRRQALPLQV